MAAALAYEKFWVDQSCYDETEKKYYEYMNQLALGKKPMCPAMVQKAASVAAAQPASPVGLTVAEKSSVVAAPAASVPQDLEQTKLCCKKDKKKTKKRRKDASPSPEPEPSTGNTVVPSVHAAAAELAATEEQAKKKKQKSKKTKAGQDGAATEHGAKNTNNKRELTSTGHVQQENAKNQKEKENLAHKLCDNITGELTKMSSFPAQCTLASEISKARQHIKNSLERMDGIAALAASPGAELLDRLSSVEKENEKLRSVIDSLNDLVIDLRSRVKALEGQ